MADNKNTNLLPSFLGGLLTGFVIIPVVSEALNIVYSYIQAALIKPTKAVIKGNAEVEEMQNANTPVNTNVIGFEVPDLTEYYDDEDDDYDKKSKKRNKI